MLQMIFLYWNLDGYDKASLNMDEIHVSIL